MQLSIFLIDLFVGTYRMSSHARLEAFVIQTKLNLRLAFSSCVTGLFYLVCFEVYLVLIG